jgi:hypothetical protein
MSVELVCNNNADFVPLPDPDNLDPPSSLKVNVKGLSPRRAELARLVAWRQAIVSELEISGSGRRDLADHIRRLEQAKATADGETVAAVDNVLTRIKQGLAWSIVPSKPVPDFATELQIAKMTPARLDAERASKDSLVSLLGGVSRLRRSGRYMNTAREFTQFLRIRRQTFRLRWQALR